MLFKRISYQQAVPPTPFTIDHSTHSPIHPFTQSPIHPPPMPSTPRAGYTLPVFACAAAIAAVQRLQSPQTTITSVQVDLVKPAQQVEIPIDSSAPLPDGSILAIAHSDPGDNLDLTRHTPIWAVAAWGDGEQSEPLQINAGEGIGRQRDQPEQAAIYRYAQTVLHQNLIALLQPEQRVTVTIILPAGRSLAERTSNAAFGIVEGLSLLGTSGIAAPLSAPGQLAEFRTQLQVATQHTPDLVFCIGENGLNLAQTLGIPAAHCLKTANWLGSMLAEAGAQSARSILLFGYHGKLLKLAGGIFHTHHYLADGRREILTAQSAIAGLPPEWLGKVFTAETAEAALQHLRQAEQDMSQAWVERIYGAIAADIDRRATAYIHAHTGQTVTVGSLLFGRDRQIVVTSPTGQALRDRHCQSG